MTHGIGVDGFRLSSGDAPRSVVAGLLAFWARWPCPAFRPGAYQLRPEIRPSALKMGGDRLAGATAELSFFYVADLVRRVAMRGSVRHEHADIPRNDIRCCIPGRSHAPRAFCPHTGRAPYIPRDGDDAHLGTNHSDNANSCTHSTSHAVDHPAAVPASSETSPAFPVKALATTTP